MKALTVSQPFAELIAIGQKWVENRRWYTPYRGALAIHAGRGTQYLPRSELRHYDIGCFVAVCELLDCVGLTWLANGLQHPAWETRVGRTIQEVLNHPHTEGPVCWILGNVRRLSRPIPYRGRQGLFEVPDELLAEAIPQSTGSSSLCPGD